MHAKTIIIDRKIVLTGSVNMTHNGFERNKEHLFRITDPVTVKAVSDEFDEVWTSQQVLPVHQSEIELMMDNWRRRDQKKKSSRSVSRSLSQEVADV